MSYFICDGCEKRHEIFTHGGAKKAGLKLGIPFLGEIPLDLDIRLSGDSGAPIVAAKPHLPQARAFLDIAERLVASGVLG
jgi:ATP-binding protein involved in chromosome partitioning